MGSIHAPPEMKLFATLLLALTSLAFSGKISELTRLMEKEQQIFGDTLPLKAAQLKKAAWSPPANSPRSEE